MIYPYSCEACKNRVELNFPMGQNPREVSCPKCGKRARRVYEGMSIALKIGNVFSKGNSTSTFGEQQKQRNRQAANRMRDKKPPVRLSAYDYGNGDVRGVEK
jgi:putative FmdB family regulatory protein